jgi:tetratricopeptide (TPR) repeat protein
MLHLTARYLYFTVWIQLATRREEGFVMSVSRLTLAIGLLLAAAAAFGQQESATRTGGTPAPTIDATTGKALNTAIEALNMDKYDDAQVALATLNLEKLSPYERSKVEQILFSIAYAQEKFSEAREHLHRAISAGGLNEQEISAARYQDVQLYMNEERWKEGAAALEEWFKTAVNPNSAAYYLLAAAYYQLNEYDRALPPAKKAVELTDKPQEGWIGMLLALHLAKEQYREAVPLLHRLIELVPDKKAYWMQLSGVYGLIEDYPHALAVMQLAYGAGLVTEDAEARRLADLLLFNDIPYRCAQVLEAAVERKIVKLDEKFYEKLANCWIAAGELDRGVAPLEQAAELSSTGDSFVRLGELNVQREDWAGAATAIERGIAKGELRDAANAQLYMGIALFSQKKLAEARPWFERARQSEKHRQTAGSYLQIIDAELTPRRTMPH